VITLKNFAWLANWFFLIAGTAIYRNVSDKVIILLSTVGIACALHSIAIFNEPEKYGPGFIAWLSSMVFMLVAAISKGMWQRRLPPVVISLLPIESHCRVCGHDQAYPPWGTDGKTPSHDICACCGTEFGYQDCTLKTVKERRRQWLARGRKWVKEKERPLNWDWEKQLENIPAFYK